LIDPLRAELIGDRTDPAQAVGQEGQRNGKQPDGERDDAGQRTELGVGERPLGLEEAAAPG
jgi:hypothetical protein